VKASLSVILEIVEARSRLSRDAQAWDEPVAVKRFTALANAPAELHQELLEEFVAGKLLTAPVRPYRGDRPGEAISSSI
jgi:hypothetical protein